MATPFLETVMTTPPKTLLDMAGATPAAARFSDAILLIIDAQREYVDGSLPLAGMHEALSIGGTLLQRARDAGTPVVHVLHRGSGQFFNPAGTGFQPVAPLTPHPGETVIEKTLANSFVGTELEEVLARSGRKNLIVIGFMTHNCVSSTVRAAKDRGYTITVVAPATATRDLPDGRGGTIPASVLQTACLAGLGDTMARIAWYAEEIQD